MLSSIIDISARKRAEEQLRQQADSLPLPAASLIPRQHVARAAHAAEQYPDPERAIARQYQRQPELTADDRARDIIYRSGSDLLNLINDIPRSVENREAGRVVVAQEAILLTDLADNIATPSPRRPN